MSRAASVASAGLAMLWLMTCAPAVADDDAGPPYRHAMHGSPPPSYGLWLLDKSEYGAGTRPDTWNWDARAWIGGDYDRLWLKTEGERSTSGTGTAEIQALYGRLVSPFWDLQAGVRYARRDGPGGNPTRASAALSMQGTAPYWIETDAALFLSDKGIASVRLKADYELLFTQRLVLQPDLEINAAARQDAEFGAGAGLGDLAMGLRLRYEILREFAPYAGIEWRRLYGGTAALGRAGAEEVEATRWVAGVRAWF